MDCPTYRRTHFVAVGPCCEHWVEPEPAPSMAESATQLENYYAPLVLDMPRPTRKITMLQRDKIVRCGVAAFIWHPPTNEVLLIQRGRSHGAGTWSVPGGWMEFGETPEGAAIREAREEVGLAVYGLQPQGYTSSTFVEDGIHSLTLWFTAVAGVKDLEVNAEEISDYRWVNPIDPLPSNLFAPLQAFLTQHPVPGWMKWTGR